MASRSDVSELLSRCRWSDEGSYLGEITKNSGFPLLCKVSRGQYQNIGQPSFSNPSLVSHVLLVSAGRKLSIAAQCVKFKNARQRVVPYGPTLSIPQDFEGHFEILSEDGRAVPCIQTVSALTRKFPDACLVREALKAYKPDAKSAVIIPKLQSPHPQKLGAGELCPDTSISSIHPGIQPSYKISDKTRLLQPGEILVLVGEVSVPTGKKVSRYLRCFDSKGQTVYLNSAQKGKFSPLARQDSIGGVHTTKNILTKRLPLMVRLVEGKPPVMPSAKTSSFKFVPELRLFSTLHEQLIFAMPLSQNWKDNQTLVPLPLSVPLKFQVCRNMSEVEHMKEFSRIHEKVKMLVDFSKNLIQIYDINLKKELRFDGRQWKAYAPPLFLSPTGSPGESLPIAPTPTAPPPETPALSSLPLVEKGGTSGGSNCTYDEIPDAQDYEDIDEIYDYVRGIKPPPTAPPRAQSNNAAEGKVVSNNNANAPLQLDCQKASQYQKHKSSGYKKQLSSNHRSSAPTSRHVDKSSPTTIVTITTPPGHNEPDLIVGAAQAQQPPPVPKRGIPYGRLLSSRSLDRLDASDSEEIDYDMDDDEEEQPPPPPPIETIPSKQNLFFLNPPGGVSVSVSNKNSKNNMLSKDKFPTGESETVTNEIHNNGGSVQIQIRSTTTANLNNSHNAHHHHHHSAGYPYSLGSTGNSLNTTPTNTSGSGGSYGSSSSGDNKKGKPKQHLYVKHNNNNSHASSNTPLTGGNLDLNGKGLSGSPANRIVFRRSPIFDCRYKSMNDLNRNSLDSGAGLAVGSSSQRHRLFPHSGSHVNIRESSTPSAGLNLNLNLLNLNMNLKASAKASKKGIFRPKSLTNLVFTEDSYHPFGSSSGGGGGGALVGGVKKKLTDMVVPSHQHATHTPPPPPVEILQKVPLNKCGASSRARKTSTPQTPTMYL